MEKLLPSIPAKRYFTIGEVGDLCGVKPHVLRYWEQEFNQLRPMKRRGNRRYYQHHEVLMIRRIRDLLYDQGFTISGARNKIQELIQAERELKKSGLDVLDGLDTPSDLELDASPFEFSDLDAEGFDGTNSDQTPMQLIRRELQEISYLLGSEDRSKG
jgi:DNA-binding transcriptional MerR regulator